MYPLASRHPRNAGRARSARSGHREAFGGGAGPQIRLRGGLLQGLDLVVAKHEAAHLVDV